MRFSLMCRLKFVWIAIGSRERVVSEDVMRRMAAKQKPPTFEEGFGKITVVRVKQKEGSAAAED